MNATVRGKQQKCDLDLADLLAIYSYLEVFYPLRASKNTKHRDPKCSSRGLFKDVGAQKFPRTDFFKTLTAGRK